MSRLLIGFLVSAAFLNGCAVGPDYVKPEAPVESQWMAEGMPGIKTADADYSQWWQVYNDPVLNTLMERAYQQNLSLQIAGIRIYQARAQLGIVVGNLYPQQQAAAGALSNNRVSENAAGVVLDRDFNDLSVGFDAAWELDFWGKFRRSVESGTANLEASIASYDDFLVALTAEVARTYILIRTLESRLSIARKNVEIQERSLRIARARFEGGDVSELDVAQARTLLSNTQALIPSLETGLRQAKNALAILLGILPTQIASLLQEPGSIPRVSDQVAVDIPAELLRRRPDIRLAELRVASQSPQIGVAKADLFPHFVLFGSIGWQTTDAKIPGAADRDLGDLFDSKSLFWSAGPAINWDILNYGRIKNRVRVEDARFQQLVVDYKEKVLRAYQEVEDAMVGFVKSREEEQFLQESVDAAQRSVDLSLLQYREGLTDYQRVLDTQRFLATQADRLAATSGSVGINLVALYKALGGGWEYRVGKAIISTANRDAMAERTDWGGLLKPEKIEPPASEKDRGNWRWADW